jgi:hypothetical protein
LPSLSPPQISPQHRHHQNNSGKQHEDTDSPLYDGGLADRAEKADTKEALAGKAAKWGENSLAERSNSYLQGINGKSQIWSGFSRERVSQGSRFGAISHV